MVGYIHDKRSPTISLLLPIYYILHLIKNKAYIINGKSYSLYSIGLYVLQVSLVHLTCSHLPECAVAANMAIYISDYHIVFSHIDAYHSCMLGHSYIGSPDYLVVKAWIGATVLFPSFINLTCTNIHIYVKVFPEVFEYWGPSIPCHYIVAVVDVAHHSVLTA